MIFNKEQISMEIETDNDYKDNDPIQVGTLSFFLFLLMQIICYFFHFLFVNDMLFALPFNV